MLNVIMLNVIVLYVAFFCCYAECRYTKWRYAESRGAIVPKLSKGPTLNSKQPNPRQDRETFVSCLADSSSEPQLFFKKRKFLKEGFGISSQLFINRFFHRKKTTGKSFNKTGFYVFRRRQTFLRRRRRPRHRLFTDFFDGSDDCFSTLKITTV
jgi:hypothetical protein